MQWELFAVPDLIVDPKKQTILDINKQDIIINTSQPIDTKFPTTPYVKVAPLSGPVGAQLFIYGWGFRPNEDGMTITWDGEIIKCNIRAELDGRLIIDGTKRDYGTFRSGDDYTETVYVPVTTQGNHILGVYGSSFTARGVVNDIVFKVAPEIKLLYASNPDVTEITIDGTGFAGGELVTIILDKADTNIKATADGNGSFNAVLPLVSRQNKEYVVDTLGDKGNSAQASFVSALARPIPVDKSPIPAGDLLQ